MGLVRASDDSCNNAEERAQVERRRSVSGLQGPVGDDETFEVLVAGVQGALWAFGGVPDMLRSDNLSAATHELKRSAGRDPAVRFRAVLD